MAVSALALTAGPAQGSPYDRAAYFDSTYATSWAGSNTSLRDTLQQAGYKIVDAAGLKAWMVGHIADKAPSVVIFVQDDVPATVAETETATCTIRQYLNAGGKVVWYSDIPFYYQAAAGGGTTTWADTGSVDVLGFDAAGGTWDVNGTVKITTLGQLWGLTTPWSSARPAAAKPTITGANITFEVLATDTNGNAAAWVAHYLAGDTFRGFVRIDDHSGAQVNTAQLIAVAEYFVAFKTAGGPVPADGATDVPRDATLSWTAGQYPSTHDVYFGTTFADVNTASRTNAKGVLASQGQADTTFDPPGSLAYGQTYYWRIDEVNKTPDGTINKGSAWSFTAEPYGYPITGITATASSSQLSMGPENTINGSGLTGDLHGNDGTTMWLSQGLQPNWIQYQFDKAYKLYDLKVWNSNQAIEPYIGFGAKDVKIEYSTDGTTWTTLDNVPQFARAPGGPGYAANTTVNFGGLMAKYVKLTINSTWSGMAVTGLAEVRFSYVPVQARSPQPATQATGVAIAPTLSWRPGREAGSHKVFFGSDANAVANSTATAQTVTSQTFTPPSLQFATTYYWRVDEVNTVTYPGDVWSFTTTAYGVVDDFESYNDDQNRVYDTWIDGVTNGKSGSQVGYNAAPFAEHAIIHGGTQSLPLQYDNTAAFSFSEATRTFDTAQNWTASGIKSLSLWFQGAASNSGQLYLKINGTKVSYNGSASDLAKAAWTPWNIDLSTVGAGLSKVTSLTIGIEGSGSKGILYIDDIRLYPQVPQYITPVDPGKANLAALWALDGDAKDSSGKGNNGTLNGGCTWVTGKNNQALQFDGTSGWVDCGSGASLNLTDAVTITAWIKMDGSGADRKIAGNQDGTTGGYKFGIFSSNLAEFEIRTSANAATLNRTSAGGTALQQGVWYHVAGVYSKGQYIRTYVFGNLDRELVTTVLLGSSTGTFKLGREPFAASNYWLGAMDDVEVYNRALAPEEILWLAGQTKPVAKPF
jgi:hypothetical protein